MTMINKKPHSEKIKGEKNRSTLGKQGWTGLFNISSNPIILLLLPVCHIYPGVPPSVRSIVLPGLPPILIVTLHAR